MSQEVLERYAHLEAPALEVIGLPDRERIAWMQCPRWIGYKRAFEVFDELQSLLEAPTRTRPKNLLIVGSSNNGKTTVVEEFVERQGRPYVNTEGEPVKPIILAQSPPKGDEKELYMAILERFWTPYRASDPAAKLRYQLVHLMRACHVRMLIIDELHSMWTAPPMKQREVMNAIKFLCNELRIPIVGVGTRDAVLLLQTDPQHASRFSVTSIKDWELDPEFQRLLASFEKILPLKEPSNLHRPDFANALHAISEGNIGNLHELLVLCATHAIRTGLEKIDASVLEKYKCFRPTAGIREFEA